MIFSIQRKLGDVKREKPLLISHRRTQTHTDLGLNRLRPDEIRATEISLGRLGRQRRKRR